MTGAQPNELATRVLDAAFTVHTQLGPGLLENAYESCLLHELRSRGLDVQHQLALPLVYKGEKLSDVGYRIDLLINSELIVEVKAVEAIAPVHQAQLLSYLKLSGCRLGLLINFNVISLRNGIRRKVNNL